MIALLDALNRKRIRLLAHDLGGWVGFLLSEFIPIFRGRYWGSHLSTHSLTRFGVRDFALAPDLLEEYEPDADDLKVERVLNSGHLIAEDQPERVLKRALDIFGAVK